MEAKFKRPTFYDPLPDYGRYIVCNRRRTGLKVSEGPVKFDFAGYLDQATYFKKPRELSTIAASQNESTDPIINSCKGLHSRNNSFDRKPKPFQERNGNCSSRFKDIAPSLARPITQKSFAHSRLSQQDMTTSFKIGEPEFSVIKMDHFGHFEASDIKAHAEELGTSHKKDLNNILDLFAEPGKPMDQKPASSSKKKKSCSLNDYVNDLRKSLNLDNEEHNDLDQQYSPVRLKLEEGLKTPLSKKSQLEEEAHHPISKAESQTLGNSLPSSFPTSTAGERLKGDSFSQNHFVATLQEPDLVVPERYECRSSLPQIKELPSIPEEDSDPSLEKLANTDSLDKKGFNSLKSKMLQKTLGMGKKSKTNPAISFLAKEHQLPDRFPSGASKNLGPQKGIQKPSKNEALEYQEEYRFDSKGQTEKADEHIKEMKYDRSPQRQYEYQTFQDNDFNGFYSDREVLYGPPKESPRPNNTDSDIGARGGRPKMDEENKENQKPKKPKRIIGKKPRNPNNESHSNPVPSSQEHRLMKAIENSLQLGIRKRDRSSIAFSRSIMKEETEKRIQVYRGDSTFRLCNNTLTITLKKRDVPLPSSVF